MYTIIGGDGKEYGPISETDLRKWIAEGRLNAQSQAKAESDAAFRPLSTFPEFADLLGTAVAAAPAFAPIMDWNERDYELDIGGCVSRGWNVTTSHFGQLIVPVLIYFVYYIAISLLGKIPVIGPLFSIANLFITGQLMAGMFYIFILTIRGEPADIGRMFDGFRRCYWQIFFGTIVQGLFFLLAMAPALIVFFARAAPVLSQFRNANAYDMQGNLPAMMAQLKPAIMSCLPFIVVSVIVGIYLSINWQFTLPLIIDRQMGFWTAMKTGWKMVHKHWFTVFGLAVVIGLINLAGFVLCCVGLIFTIPLGFASLMCGYETIFSESRAA